MKMMMASLILAALSVAGCNTTKIDSALQQGIPFACSNAPKVHAAFLAVVAVKPVSAKVMAKEAQGYNAIVSFCSPPLPADTASAAVRLAGLYAQYVAVTKLVQ